MPKSKSFKSVKLDVILKQYKLTVIGLWVLHALTLPIAGVLIAMGLTGRMLPMNAVLSAFFALFANYLLRALRQMKLSQIARVLTFDCDPVKYEALFRKIQEGGWKNPIYSFNIARALYYQGNWEGAMAELKKLPLPKDKSPMIFQYYNLLAGCYELAGDSDKIIEVREKVKKVLAALKEKSPQSANGRHLLTIIDGMLTYLRGNITRCREIYDELYDNASFTLSRLTALWKLAQIDQLSGAGRSAIDRCEYIIDAGGTTFYVSEANRILALCRGGRNVAPQALEAGNDVLEDDEEYEDEED